MTVAVPSTTDGRRCSSVQQLQCTSVYGTDTARTSEYAEEKRTEFDCVQPLTENFARRIALLKLTTDMKHRAASLRQQSYLFHTPPAFDAAVTASHCRNIAIALDTGMVRLADGEKK